MKTMDLLTLAKHVQGELFTEIVPANPIPNALSAPLLCRMRNRDTSL